MIVGQVVDKMPSAHLRRADSRLIDSETLIGVEIEVEGCSRKLPNTRSESGYWTPKEDHSLREGGMEFVFTEPLFGADVVAAINFLCDQALALRYKISERTGIHVHMDTRGMEVEKFQNFCILYALTERLLYNWVGDKRESNIHCLPWYMADGDLGSIGAIFKNPKEAPAIIKNINRYSGLNLNCLLTFGSAEFRQLKTTFDPKRILDWINIILSLKQAGEAWAGTPDQLIREMRLLGAFGFTSKVFRDQVHKLWYPDFSQHFLGTGIPVATQLIEGSRNISSDSLAKKMYSHVRNEEDERGEHPGVAKYRSRNKKQEKKKINTPFGSITTAMYQDLAVPPGGSVVWANEPQVQPWPQSLNQLEEEP